MLAWLGVSRWGSPEVVFIYTLFFCLASSRTSFLDDPDTFWHLQVGREILKTGAMPQADVFTYTQSGTRWIDQSWGFDVILALIVDHVGWPGAVAASSLLIAWVYWALTRELIATGASFVTALAIGILAMFVGAFHFLTRPHLVSLALALWMFTLCRKQHQGSPRALWPVPLVMVLWANMHGGFIAGVLILGTALIGHALSGPWDWIKTKGDPEKPELAGEIPAQRDKTWSRTLRNYAIALVVAMLAPLATPYGVDLYRHVVELLFTSGLTGINMEFQPTKFESLVPSHFELFLLSLIALPTLGRGRATFYEMAHALVWLHLALTTVRYGTIFGLAAAPALARLLDGWISQRPDDRPRTRPGSWRLPLAITLGLVLAVEFGAPLGALGAKRWPLKGLQALNAQPIEDRVFHEQNWGGMIEAMANPRRPSYMDNRFEIFGKAMILDYLDALQGGEKFDEIVKRYDIQLVWMKPDRKLTKRLRADPERWTIIFEDDVSVLFRRKELAPAPSGP